MLQKPSLEDPPGQIVDPAFMPAELRNRLLKHLVKLNLDEHQRAEFLDRCAEWCHEALGGSRGAGLDDQQTQLRKIASDARRLLSAINVAAPETIGNIRSHGDYLLMTHTAPDIGLPSALKGSTGKYGKIVSEAWDYVQAIEILATYAADKIKLSKQHKPDQEIARGLVKFIAGEFQNVTGSLPPDTRASWFAKFMALIGNHYRIPCGPGIIRGAIADLGGGDTLIR